MYIRVKAKPNSKKESIEKIKENEFIICVREPAKGGLANKRICQLVFKHFDNPPGGVKIISGHMSQVKLLKVGDN
ncbi:MAG TPA: DUF167 domain-containing protein [Candidatus Paceibacterota bacterium]|nr:DUF167 domain-containing protein [Candidatus Paceibacterota bacterium]HMP18873.1 DUF167 domain-containing protein [Candidatus Paceibacterota bacterium]HMP85163.1 DUF167 domain-containing protein [Candidatus Paceibacterota bacterium]